MDKNDIQRHFNMEAFPLDINVVGDNFNPGMSLVDWFAGQALVGLIDLKDPDNCAKSCYRYALAMMAERERLKEGKE